jgi:hypothetical protein
MRQRRTRRPSAVTGLAVAKPGPVEVKIERKSTDKRSSHGPIHSVCSYIKGGRKSFMQMAILASQIEPNLQPIIDSYENLTPPAQRTVDLDALCKLNEVEPAHFLAVVAEAAHKFSQNSSILVAALNMPMVVKKSIQVAQTQEGHRDRKMLFEHAGFIPTSGGINITQIAKANAASQANNSATERGMPTFEADIVEAEQDD